MLMLELDSDVDPVKRAELLKQLKVLQVTDVEEERLTYSKTVVKMFNDHHFLVFNLSEQSNNETIESVSKMSLGHRLMFQRNIAARNRKLSQRSRGNAEQGL